MPEIRRICISVIFSLLLPLSSICLDYYEDCVDTAIPPSAPLWPGAPSSFSSTGIGGGTGPSSPKADVCTTAECVKAAGNILSMMDPAVEPCRDFYQFACGGFQVRQNIPAGESGFDQFSASTRMRKKQLLNLLEAPANDGELSSRQKARRYYKACVDTKALEAYSVPRMQDMVMQLGGLLLKCNEAVPKNWSLNSLLAMHDNFAGEALFKISVGPDYKKVNQYAVILEQGSLLLGPNTRDYYVNKTVANDAILLAEVNLLEKLARLVVGEKASINRNLLVEVVQFDKKRAEIQQSIAEMMNVLALYNKVSVTFLQQNVGFINWEQYLQDMFMPAYVAFNRNDPIVLLGLPYFANLTELINEYLQKVGGKRIIQNYFVFKALITHADTLGGGFQVAMDEFKAFFKGKQGSQERWQICMDDVEKQVGFPLGAMFVEKYFTPQDKERATAVISSAIKMFRNNIQKVIWMEDDTRERAFEKFDALDYQIAFPDWLFNSSYMENRYANLIVVEDYIQNKVAAYNYQRMRLISKFHELPDKTEWLMTPQTTNAYYNPLINSIVIPAGILTTPFYYSSDGVPLALNYGAIGAIAGHEITHGFDTIGRLFDRDGNLNDWWFRGSEIQFLDRARCFIDKYNNYEVDGLHLKGDQTVSENIADDGGIRAAFAAYKNVSSINATSNSSGYKKIVGLDAMTNDQLFFLGWAQAWCSVQTSAYTKLLIQADTHSPNRFRVNGPLSNSVDFSNAFSCPPGTPMYSSLKCSLW